MSKRKNDKKLSDRDYLTIEVLLNQGSPPAEIGRHLNRDPSGIRKEIKKFGVFISKGIAEFKCKNCLNYSTCSMHYMCDELKNHSICAACRHCREAPKVCPYYEEKLVCSELDKRHVCNGCPKLRSCNITYRYIAKYAILKHHSMMNVSHRVLKIQDLPEEFLIYIATLIKHGISPDVILNTLPFRFRSYKVSTPTLYSYIDKHLIPGVSNMDLRFKVSRVRNGSGSRITRQPHTHQLNGRSIEDLPEEEKSYPQGYVEIDTVVGIAGHAVLFTMLFPKYSLMYTRKLKNKTQEEVKRVLDELESSLGKDFYLLFRTVVPDNGSEFTNPDILEQSAVTEGAVRFHVYYTHSYSSFEKPHVENMHILLRWLVQKGADIEELTENDIEEIILRLNNYPRPNKGYKTPIELLEMDLGHGIISKLGLRKIPIEKLDMHVILHK